MPTITIPNIPEDLMEKMQSYASANGRALEDEALSWLQSAKNGTPPPRKHTPEELAELDRELRRLHARLPMMDIDNDELNRYKREGRL